MDGEGLSSTRTPEGRGDQAEREARRRARAERGESSESAACASADGTEREVWWLIQERRSCALELESSCDSAERAEKRSQRESESSAAAAELLSSIGGTGSSARTRALCDCAACPWRRPVEATELRELTDAERGGADRSCSASSLSVAIEGGCGRLEPLASQIYRSSICTGSRATLLSSAKHKEAALGSRIRKSVLDQTIASNLSSFRNGQLSVMYCLSPYDYSSWASEVPVCFQFIPQSLCLLCVCIYANFGTYANARATLHKNANPGPLQT
jgi:hypothetical protein